MGGAISIKLLEGAAVDQVSRFRLSDDLGKPLVRFIRRDAVKSASANLTRTYVAKEEGESHVLAYISIMCAEIAFEQTYSIADKIGADRYEYQPAVRIARLAVDSGSQKQGLGERLVKFVIGIVLAAIQPAIGCRFLVLDAKRPSIAFYEKLGFRLLDTEANRAKDAPMMFLDLQGIDWAQ